VLGYILANSHIHCLRVLLGMVVLNSSSLEFIWYWYYIRYNKLIYSYCQIYFMQCKLRSSGRYAWL